MSNSTAMIGHNSASGEKLRQYITQIEQLEREKAATGEHIKDVFTVAKSNGFDTKIMRIVLKLRKLDTSKRQEMDAMTETYLHALGMLPDFEEKE